MIYLKYVFEGYIFMTKCKNILLIKGILILKIQLIRLNIKL